MQRRGQYFIIKYESIAWSSLRYLEVEVKKRKYRYEVTPAYKKSNLGIPLDVQSCQPAHVHTSWPKAAIARARCLASSEAAARSALRVLKMRFTSHFAPDPIIAMFDSDNNTTRMATGSNIQPTIWITISYFPGWELPLQRALKSFLEDEAHDILWRRSFGERAITPMVKIAWRNVLPCTMSMLRQLENRAAKRCSNEGR